jgi:hypothetical protein
VLEDINHRPHRLFPSVLQLFSRRPSDSIRRRQIHINSEKTVDIKHSISGPLVLDGLQGDLSGTIRAPLDLSGILKAPSVP